MKMVIILVELYPAGDACSDLVGNVDVLLGSNFGETSDQLGKAQELDFSNNCWDR
jgi:hypothetical protein